MIPVKGFIIVVLANFRLMERNGKRARPRAEKPVLDSDDMLLNPIVIARKPLFFVLVFGARTGVSIQAFWSGDVKCGPQAGRAIRHRPPAAAHTAQHKRWLFGAHNCIVIIWQASQEYLSQNVVRIAAEGRKQTGVFLYLIGQSVSFSLYARYLAIQLGEPFLGLHKEAFDVVSILSGRDIVRAELLFKMGGESGLKGPAFGLEVRMLR